MCRRKKPQGGQGGEARESGQENGVREPMGECVSGRRASVQFSRLVVSGSLQPRGLQHVRPPCPSPSPGACSNSCPLSRWCHPTISSSVIPFSSCVKSFPASGSFPMSQFLASGGQSIGVSASASVLPMNIQDWSPSRWTGWISLLSRGLSKVFSNTTVQMHQFFSAQLSLWSNSHIGLVIWWCLRPSKKRPQMGPSCLKWKWLVTLSGTASLKRWDIAITRRWGVNGRWEIDHISGMWVMMEGTREGRSWSWRDFFPLLFSSPLFSFLVRYSPLLSYPFVFLFFSLFKGVQNLGDLNTQGNGTSPVVQWLNTLTYQYNWSLVRQLDPEGHNEDPMQTNKKCGKKHWRAASRPETRWKKYARDRKIDSIRLPRRWEAREAESLPWTERGEQW